jgi:hypothetical protein
MPLNTNPWVTELLTWHGQARGGVSVPFRPGAGKPLKRVLDTPLHDRLRRLAAAICSENAPQGRWIFLVGGPGNGKSEAVEQFITMLDQSLGLQGELVEAVSNKLLPRPMTPRRVAVEGADLPHHRDRFGSTLRALVLVQDASAVVGANDAAEDELISDVEELLSGYDEGDPVFVCCANRGLLARAVSRAAARCAETSPVAAVLRDILQATGLNATSFGRDRLSCWPLDCDARFACWPLDLESLLTETSSAQAPFEQILRQAVSEENWRANGRCLDCDSAPLCPFFTNAQILLDSAASQRLIRVLRHGELALGRRWNFRDAFSLCAELIVGFPDDFGNGSLPGPCEWVHGHATLVAHGNSPPGLVLPPLWLLTSHLYQHVLFPRVDWPHDTFAKIRAGGAVTTQAVHDFLGSYRRAGGKVVRGFLEGPFSDALDPAAASPPEMAGVLSGIEDEFGQSVAQGLSVFGCRLSPLEARLLGLLADAEAEWEGEVHESGRAREIVYALRRLASAMAKRSLGIQDGCHLNDARLDLYQSLLRNQDGLLAIVGPVREALSSGGRFAGSLVRVFGQPDAGRAGDVVVRGALGPVLPMEAPRETESCPGHDLPVIAIGEQMLPLTYGIFEALELRMEGCEIASFTPATRAALDKVRNVIASALARNAELIRGGEVGIMLAAERWRLQASAGGGLTLGRVPTGDER